jgi:MoaA/NifB/PqqE/SkfB family radical SAM enzyme
MNKSRFKKRNIVAERPKYWVRLTRFCNNNCIFCLDKQNQNGTHLELKEIKNELKKGRKLGINKLILSGGEPTLHPDYLKIIKFSKDIGYKEIQNITNGRMFAYKNFLEKAVKNGLTETTFSIHGHTKELYEKQSGIKDSYEQALAGLINVLNFKNLIVNIDIVINKINYKYLEKIIRFFINLGVKEFDLLQVIPFGAAWENKKNLFYDSKIALPYLQKAFSLQKKYPDIYLWTNRFPAQYLEGFEEMIQHPIKLQDEIRGRKEILEDFLKRNKIMNCYGAQCQYCFLKDFCSDLSKIKKTGKLASKDYPYCLKMKQPKDNTFFWKNFDIDKFLDFFIKYRYFVKSLRCNNCRYDKTCSGMQIDYIRKYGFKKLKPSK